MNLSAWIGHLLGLRETQSVDRIDPSLAAPWAHDSPAWLVFGCLALATVALIFYARFQLHVRPRARLILALMRACALCLILLILAEPVLMLHVTTRLRPVLWILFDGTDSMAIEDDLPQEQRTRFAEAVGLPLDATSNIARVDYLKALLHKKDANVLARLGEKFRVRAFLFDRVDEVHTLDLSPEGNIDLDGPHLAEQLTTTGEVTALGAAMADLARRQTTGGVAGLIVFSDFNQNSGPGALDSARRLAIPVFPVGVGPIAAIDLGIDLQSPVLMKKDERTILTATLRQTGLLGEEVTIAFTARRLGTTTSIDLGERNVRLQAAVETIEHPYIPLETGQFTLFAQVEPIEGEVVLENNRTQRESTVRDDYLRLLSVEYQPTWHWRFVKEVFHRDKLVGRKGFRTFLRSADPHVRQTNELFLPSLTLPRSEFFEYDVILLGDMPATSLSPGFCRMTKEFVDDFGGGLVVIAGPQFGPGELANTQLGDLLPVKIEPGSRLRDTRPFELLRTAESARYDFMQLGENGVENEKAWMNLGKIPWYFPAQRLRPLAVALAEHPVDLCVDGKARQPIIATHQYGRGEVVYLGFDETWRLRRKYGERYYRQFWGQLIHRLALRHALGSQKRFVLRTDRRQYQTDDEVRLTVEAFDADFKPLDEDAIPGQKLLAELIPPSQNGHETYSTRTLGIRPLREGLFEARIPVFTGGEHRVRVLDPITDKYVETTFRVQNVSAERQRAVRNSALALSLADTTGGVCFDLTDVEKLPNAIDASGRVETSIEVIPLWNTWLVFIVLSLLLLGEWLGRKRANLP